MLKKILVLLVSVYMLTAAAYAAPMGLLLTYVGEPVAATALSGYDRMGEASAFGLFGLVAFGDAGIDAASTQAGISAVHHVDKTCLSLLGGLFMMETTKVYGNAKAKPKSGK